MTLDLVIRKARLSDGTAPVAIGEGTTLIRTQVEIDPVAGLAGFEAVRQLRSDYA